MSVVAVEADHASARLGVGQEVLVGGHRALREARSCRSCRRSPRGRRGRGRRRRPASPSGSGAPGSKTNDAPESVDDVLDLALGEAGVHRHRDGAQHLDAEEGEHPVDAVGEADAPRGRRGRCRRRAGHRPPAPRDPTAAGRSAARRRARQVPRCRARTRPSPRSMVTSDGGQLGVAQHPVGRPLDVLHRVREDAGGAAGLDDHRASSAGRRGTCLTRRWRRAKVPLAHT